MKIVKTSLVILLATFFSFAMFTFDAWAGDVASGAKVFGANCAACHAGGRNVVMADKTLYKDALQKYGMDSESAIINQVTNGKGAMPAFKGRLSDDQIADVTAYVLSQAEKGW